METATRIRYSVEGGIALFELNDPPANTYTHEMMRELDDVVELQRLRPRLRAPLDVHAARLVEHLRERTARLALAEPSDELAHTVFGHEEVRGERIGAHFDEVVYVLEGILHVRALGEGANSVFELGPDDAAYIPQGVGHEYRSYGAAPVRALFGIAPRYLP